jgi:hypothetical protein
VVLLLTVKASANGGWTEDYFSVESGPVYSGTEHPEIALEKEVLKFEGFDEDGTAGTRVDYEFRNESDREVVVDAAFPVDVWADLGEEGESFLIYGHEKGADNKQFLDFWKKVFGNRLVVKYDKEQGQYMGRIGRKKVEGEEIISLKTFGKRFGKYVDFGVSQDGEDVVVESVAVQTHAKSVYGADEIGALGDWFHLKATFHFKYSMSFSPRATSSVAARYRVPGLAERSSYGTHGSIIYDYEWFYQLWPGGTWNGPIKRLFFVLPHEIAPGPQMSYGWDEYYEDLGQVGSMHVFMAKDYEPAHEEGKEGEEDEGDYLYAHWSRYDAQDVIDHHIEHEDYEELPEEPSVSFARMKGASSTSPDHSDIYSVWGIYKGLGFGPGSLLDDISESAWCTESGKGVGEWVEIELDRDMLGLSVQNGFLHSAAKVKGQKHHKAFKGENRVKVLEIVSSKGEVVEALSLADTKDEQDFLHVKLPKGTYRLKVAEIYKAKKKGARTCLGEIVPYPDSDVLEKHQFLAKHFWAGGK